MLNKNTRGFTLLEILLVLIIMTVIASMSIPSFYSQLQQTTLKQDAMNVYQLITQAHYEAITAQKKIVLQFDKNNNTLSLKYLTDNQDLATSYIKQITLTPDTELTSGGKGDMWFYPSGLMEERRIILGNENKKICISTQERINHVDVFEI